MKSTQEILAQLERLEVQVKSLKNLIAIGQLKENPVIQSPNTFKVGDFVVTDMHLIKNTCGPKGCS